jgi:hypothetical protein
MEPLMSLQEFLRQFDTLPDDAIAPDRFAAAILGVSIWTLQRENRFRRGKFPSADAAAALVIFAL